jgi:hypothetical protein
LVDGTIDQEQYTNQTKKVGTDLQEAAFIESEALIEISEVISLLDFTSWVLSNASSIWLGASIEVKLRLQQSFFPNGLTASKTEVGTAPTSTLFERIQVCSADKTELASPAGFEPALPP